MIPVFFFASCSDFESEPREFVSEDYIWDSADPSGIAAQDWVACIYAQLPSGYNRINGLPLECASDDAVPSDPTSNTWNIVTGGYSPSVTFDDCFSNSYAGIRKANLFLKNYQRISWSDRLLARYLASESRFLRVFFYYELIKRYGGVPLIGDKVLTLEDDLSLPRNSFDECVSYMTTELDAIKDSVRDESYIGLRRASNDSYFGRIYKGTVRALKAKVLLLAASPLWNPSNDLKKWEVAAAAADSVIQLKSYQYDATGKVTAVGPAYELIPNRYDLYTKIVTSESLFVRNTGGGNNNLAYALSPVGFRVNNTDSKGVVSPTQELVDAFGMKNGKAITDLTSGYDPLNPYKNRDPRLDQTVFYNGMKWAQRAIETFGGGKDVPANLNVKTVTGYYDKKFLSDDSNNNRYNSNAGTWMIIRYADILLMYAEARNEFLSSPDQRVYDAVNAVRTRAGITTTLTSGSLNQDQMRLLIRNERRNEFAFEEQRFWDIRRWKIANVVYGSTNQSVSLHGVVITKNSNGTLSYTKSVVATPYFDSQSMFLFPFSKSEMLKNSNLSQNPGY